MQRESGWPLPWQFPSDLCEVLPPELVGAIELDPRVHFFSGPRTCVRAIDDEVAQQRTLLIGSSVITSFLGGATPIDERGACFPAGSFPSTSIVHHAHLS
jgi:hypothetical protein